MCDINVDITCFEGKTCETRAIEPERTSWDKMKSCELFECTFVEKKKFKYSV